MTGNTASIVPIREQIYEQIKDAILTNEYKPGDIIQIDRLARLFGVSATPIRETLIRLENSGLLKLIPNKGAIITEFTKEDIKHTWEMRKILEPYAGGLTADLDVKDEIERIENLVKSILDSAYELHNYMKTDKDLHELLFIHINNKLLRETIQRIHHISIRMRYFAESVAQNHQNVVQEVCSEHLDILNKLKSKDSRATEKSVLRHIENSEKRTLLSTN
ncbi:MAG: GntR family transcriptional regulator [Spirochaetia bacterium]|jgi:DNA-binding GntR family transcriptional regulator|nr:GntR family transcriptional regulator [Spirochaetia bacterium]